MYVGCLKGTDIHVTHMLVNSTTIILLEKINSASLLWVKPPGSSDFFLF